MRKSYVRDGEKLAQRNIQARIDEVYIPNKKKAGMFFHPLDLFKKESMNTLSCFLFEIFMEACQKALHHQLKIVVVRYEFVVSRFDLTLAYYDEASSDDEDVPSVAASALQRRFSSDQFRHTGRRRIVL